LLKHTIFEENFASYPNLGVCSGEEEEENERIAYDEPGQEKCPPGIFWVVYVWGIRQREAGQYLDKMVRS
jgi:hypothetical protein